MSNPSKRPRTDDNDDNVEEAENKEITPDQEAWFPDGNIDIVAERTAFRVHRGVLSAQSELFRDMLSIPQPENAKHNGDRSVVAVTDSAVDMRHLLLVLYYCNESFRPEKKADFKVVSSLVRLAHKYQIKRVLDEAMSRIKALYPNDLDRFLEVVNGRHKHHNLDHDPSIDCFEVVHLARLIGDNSLLLPAFYYCCKAAPGSLLGKQADGGYSAAYRLSNEDVERCIFGGRYLAQAAAYVRRETLKIPAECGEWECKAALDTISSSCGLNESPRTWFPLWDAFESLDKDDWLAMGLCGECKEAMSERERTAQEFVWDALPKYLQLFNISS